MAAFSSTQALGSVRGGDRGEIIPPQWILFSNLFFLPHYWLYCILKEGGAISQKQNTGDICHAPS